METRSYRLKDNRKKEKRLSYNLNMLHPRKLLFGEIFAIDIQLLWIRPFRKNDWRWLVTTTENLISVITSSQPAADSSAFPPALISSYLFLENATASTSLDTNWVR